MGNILDGIQRPLRVRPFDVMELRFTHLYLGDPTGLSIHLHTSWYQHGRFGP